MVTVLGCNVGSKFDIEKLNFNKIIIASDADVDGYFIRSLLLAFFFKLFPQIIEAGKVYIAEPPLYRVEDKKDPFVVNKKDFINRYVKAASKDYKLGYQKADDDLNIAYLKPDEWMEFLDQTSSYVDDIELLAEHYKANDRLLEMIIEEFAIYGRGESIEAQLKNLDIQHLVNRIGEEFPEIYFDDDDNLIKGVIDSRYQMIEISDHLIRKAGKVISIMKDWLPGEDEKLILKDIRTGTERQLSLLGALKILKRYAPKIGHRFKG